MEVSATYGPAIIALVVFVLMVLFQSAMVGAGKAKAGLTPGAEPAADYANALYRLNRSHQNGVEIMPAAAIALVLCILLGVSGWWVNVLMGLFVLTRIIYVIVYAQEVGKPTQGIRTGVFVAGWAMLVILLLMAAWAAF